MTAPRGRMSFLPDCASSSLASAMRSASTSDEPTSSPIAAKNVHAIAPPINSSSTRGSSERMTSIFPEILAPPSTAINGRFGSRSNSPRYLSSFSMRKPATAGLSRCDRFSRRVCAMGGAERVVHVDIAEGREGARELGIVLFFARPEARVLDERDAAARQASRGGNAGRGIGDELDGRGQPLLQVEHDMFV